MNWYVAFAIFFTFLGFCSTAMSAMGYMEAKTSGQPKTQRVGAIIDSVCYVAAILFHATALTFAFSS